MNILTNNELLNVNGGAFKLILENYYRKTPFVNLAKLFYNLFR